METAKVDQFIFANGKYFDESQLYSLRNILSAAPDSKWNIVCMMQFKDPVTSLILSLFFGYLGVDRFYVGNTGLGVLKLITCGGCGIWTIIDWFMIMRAARDVNYSKLTSLVC